MNGHFLPGACVVFEKSEDFPGGSVVKKLPATQETRVRSLGQEDPLEKEGNGSPL